MGIVTSNGTNFNHFKSYKNKKIEGLASNEIVW